MASTEEEQMGKAVEKRWPKATGSLSFEGIGFFVSNERFPVDAEEKFMSNEKPGCLGAILQILGVMPKNIGMDNEESLPYAIRDDFLSQAELSFYKVLQQAVGSKVLICPKVALKDLFFVKSPDRSKHSSYSNKINLKHVDFLLCSTDNLKPLCGIELDDSSHKRADRAARDVFVEKVFETAGLPLVRFENKKSYSLADIDVRLAGIINSGGAIANSVIGKEVKQVDQEAASVSDVAKDVPTCPKCGIPMVLREAKKGDRAGQAFHGCVNYPKCRETVEFA